MNTLIKKSSQINSVKMNSRDIAVYTEKQHKHVIRDIKKLISDLYGDGPNLDDLKNTGLEIVDGIFVDVDTRGYVQYFSLDRKHTDCLLTGYSAQARMKVIQRWHELEDKSAAPQLPDFNDPAAAARAWADQFEQAKLANEKLEVADQEIQRLQGVCHTIAAQFTPGMTPAQFCRQLNGVNVQQVQNHLAQRGLLIKERHGFKSASYYRDNWFAEKVSEPQEGIVATKVVLTKKGAVNLYKFYLKGDLPMKANWDGSRTHCLFDDKPQ